MTEAVLAWIEGHVAEKGFTDEEHTRALVAAVREARTVAQEYYQDIRQLAGDDEWEKQYARDPVTIEWLVPVRKLGPPEEEP
jgi:hypothetical protein